MRKIKVCHIANNDSAVKFLLMPQLKFLVGEGYDVTVICAFSKWAKDFNADGIKAKNIKILRKISPFYDLVTLFQLCAFLKMEKFDIVHTHNPKPGLIGQLAARITGTPIVINTIHGLYFDENSSPRKIAFYSFIEKIAAKFSDLIFSQNREDAETLINRKISDAEKVRYLGNGINLEKFNPDRFSADFISQKKRQLNIPADYKIIGIIARLVREKGYIELFEAFRKVLEVLPKTILLIIGPDEPEKKDGFSREIVKEFRVEKNVTFLGERNDVDELFPVMDVFAFPSHREGFPRSLIEAAVMGKAIVATNIRGCRDVVGNDTTGILVDRKNVDELANSLILLLRDENLANIYSEEIRKSAVREFNEKTVFDRINKGYAELINRKKLK